MCEQFWIRILVERTLEADPHFVVWDGRDDRKQPVASGVYFMRLIAGDAQETPRAVLMKWASVLGDAASCQASRRQALCRGMRSVSVGAVSTAHSRVGRLAELR